MAPPLISHVTTAPPLYYSLLVSEHVENEEGSLEFILCHRVFLSENGYCRGQCKWLPASTEFTIAVYNKLFPHLTPNWITNPSST